MQRRPLWHGELRLAPSPGPRQRSPVERILCPLHVLLPTTWLGLAGRQREPNGSGLPVSREHSQRSQNAWPRGLVWPWQSLDILLLACIGVAALILVVWHDTRPWLAVCAFICYNFNYSSNSNYNVTVSESELFCSVNLNLILTWGLFKLIIQETVM